MPSNPKQKTLTIPNVDPYVVDKLDRQAAGRGMSRSAYCRRILEAALETPAEYDRISREEKMFDSLVDILNEAVEVIRSAEDQLSRLSSEPLPKEDL